MVKSPFGEQKLHRKELQRKIGLFIRKARSQLPSEEGTLAKLAEKLGLTESQLSRIESGALSLPLELLDEVAQAIGQHREQVFMGGEAQVSRPEHPFAPTMHFLDQARLLGVDGLYAERAAALTHLVAFAKRMNSGKIRITGSSLRGLEQKSDHEFITQLRRFTAGRNRDRFDCRFILTDPRLGGKREDQERRPKGSITREILTGIGWCLNQLQVHHRHIKLNQTSPSCFGIFLIEGGEGRGCANFYPTMRQAFTSFAITFRSLNEDQKGGEANSVFQTYVQANFEEPWQEEGVTIDLLEGLNQCLRAFEAGGKTGEPSMPDIPMVKALIQDCQKQDRKG